MIATILVLLCTFLILVFAEYLSRYRGVHSELTRKFVHMAVGTFVAFWPFFMSWGNIQLLSLAFFVVVSMSLKFNIFRSIHAVDRNMVGEMLFAAVIGVLALISTSQWIFMAAMLHLSLGDGLAAIVGLGWGDKNQYKIWGSTKSRVGTIAFAVTSVIITIIYVIGSGNGGIAVVVLLPLLATLAENLAVRGTDNLVMPLLVAFVLASGR